MNNILIVILCWQAWGFSQPPQTLNVAVAANFAPTLMLVKSEFEQKYNAHLKVSVASSGKHFTQIVAGAPFDIFLSADEKRPRELLRRQLAEPNSSSSYARGILVLWSKKPTDLPINQLLSQSGISIAIANPQIAPYGFSAQSLMTQLNPSILQTAKIIMGESIGQVAQFAASKSVDFAFLPLPHARRVLNGTYRILEQSDYPPINQDGVILRRTSNPKLSRQFMDYLSSERVQAIIKKDGYELPR